MYENKQNPIAIGFLSLIFFIIIFKMVMKKNIWLATQPDATNTKQKTYHWKVLFTRHPPANHELNAVIAPIAKEKTSNKPLTIYCKSKTQQAKNLMVACDSDNKAIPAKPSASLPAPMGSEATGFAGRAQSAPASCDSTGGRPPRFARGDTEGVAKGATRVKGAGSEAAGFAGAISRHEVIHWPPLFCDTNKKSPIALTSVLSRLKTLSIGDSASTFGASVSSAAAKNCSDPPKGEFAPAPAKVVGTCGSTYGATREAGGTVGATAGANSRCARVLARGAGTEATSTTLGGASARKARAGFAGQSADTVITNIMMIWLKFQSDVASNTALRKVDTNNHAKSRTSPELSNVPLEKKNDESKKSPKIVVQSKEKLTVTKEVTLTNTLNKYGKDGWELLDLVSYKDGFFYLFQQTIKL